MATSRPLAVNRLAALGPAFAVLALIAGCSGPTVPSGSAAPPQDTATGGSAPPSSAPVPALSLDPTAGWQRVDLANLGVLNTLQDVIVFDGVLLAAGSAGDAGEKPVVIRSADGVDWSAEDASSAFASPTSLAVVGDGVIALGSGGTARCAHPYAIDTWARAADGTWTEAPWDMALCGGQGSLSLLDRGGVAAIVGTGFGEQPVSWISKDGLHWVDRHPALDGFSPWTSVVDGDHLLVFGAGPDGSPQARTTGDGRTFAVAPFPRLPADASILSAIWSGGDLDVFAQDGPALGLIQRDGAEAWSTIGGQGIRADEVASIAWVGGRFVALGGDESGVALAWSSADGVTWSAIPVPGGAGTSLAAVAVLGDTAVLVGATETPDASRTVGAVWVASVGVLTPPS